MKTKRIRVIYSDNHSAHNPPYEIYDGVKEPYAEKPDRMTSIVSALKAENFSIEEPLEFSIRCINKLHQKSYIEFIKRSEDIKDGQVLYPSYFILDTYTPLTSGTYQAAVTSAHIALTGAERILSGESIIYSLCRPPGHHADTHAMSGYCYFNNAALASEYLSQKGKVAILDIDFHHGNGTQSIFYERSDVFYVSIHADPHQKFPYITGFEDERGKDDGFGFTRNYPLPLGTTDKEYKTVLEKALKDIQDFNPDYLVVSLGFDTYKKDPIGGFKLSIPFYKTIGNEFAQLQLPTLLVQEGGYHVGDLGKMAISFLKGIGEVSR